MSPLKDFHMAAQDYLQLIAKKSKQAGVSRDVANEVETLSTFYDMITGLLQRVEVELQERTLLSINEHAKAVILEHELRKTYNELHRSGSTELLVQLIRETVIPKKAQLASDVIIK